MVAVPLLERCMSLPVFPLPSVVLMPGESLPLHIFEERYRALVAHCLAGDRIMGIVTLKPNYEVNYYENPEIWPEVGIGEIVAHQPFSDGRCNIVLRFVGRGHITEEIPSPHLFRLVRCDPTPPDSRNSKAAFSTLELLVRQLGRLSRTMGEIDNLLQLPDSEMLDELARRLLDEPDAKRAYLGAPRLDERIELVTERLAGLLSVNTIAEG